MTEDISFSPITPPRPNSVYVSKIMSRVLFYAAKAEDCTREDLFERVLGAYMLEKHPAIVAWVEKRELEEKEFAKSLKK